MMGSLQVLPMGLGWMRGPQGSCTAALVVAAVFASSGTRSTVSGEEVVCVWTWRKRMMASRRKVRICILVPGE